MFVCFTFEKELIELGLVFVKVGYTFLFKPNPVIHELYRPIQYLQKTGKKLQS